MSEESRHECGVALLRLRKPLAYYHERYGSVLWPLYRLFILMEKQHNRGQDGAGLLTWKAKARPGNPYFYRIRVTEPSPPWQTLIRKVYEQLDKRLPLLQEKGLTEFYHHFPYIGEAYLAHLRYGTYGDNALAYCHPVIHSTNWRSRSLAIAGNFNLTNVDHFFKRLIEYGQHPRSYSDTETILERLSYFLEKWNDQLLEAIREERGEAISLSELYQLIPERFPMAMWLKRCAEKWDGGYVIAGLLGSGNGFFFRDPHGIRPAYYAITEDWIVAASERPAIATAFFLSMDQIHELPPGHALLFSPKGDAVVEKIIEPAVPSHCTFERIYFSRGSDPEIYQERKRLGKELAPNILKAIDDDLTHTVFTFVPNTSHVAFLGLIEALEEYQKAHLKQILLSSRQIETKELEQLLNQKVRAEVLIWKDTPLRTFIADEASRSEMAMHVYDVTYDLIEKGKDQIVCLDDSIVRGTTLRENLIRILLRLEPKKIVIASSAPQIRYPDCYGIDMARLDDLIAFQAAIQLLYETDQSELLDEVYLRCKKALESQDYTINHVKQIYQPFSAETISRKIAELVTPSGCKIPIEIVFQTIEGLQRAMPHHKGMWYFTGDFPTPGGVKSVLQAYVNFYEGKKTRSYQLFA